MRIDAISIGNDPPNEVNVIVEVPVGGEPIKYEMDKDAGTLVVDRFLYTAMRYPGNYGFIPHTLSDDGDPCDVLVANTRAIVPGAVMSVRPVGVLMMEDEAGGDEKIIAVPSSKLTQRYEKRAELYATCPTSRCEQIQHFFEHYKDLEPGKWVKVLRWGDAEDAHRLIVEGIARAKGSDELVVIPLARLLAPRNDGNKIGCRHGLENPSYTRVRERGGTALSHRRLRQPVNRAGGAQGVDQQARDRHRADAARHRRDRAGDLQRLGEGDVADQAGLAVGGRHAVDADVDHRRARLDPVAAHHFRLADGGIDEVGAARRAAGRSRVRECAIVTVAFSLSSSCTSGRPTRFERPITIAFMPASEARTLLVRMMQPSGVQGDSAARPPASRPALFGCSPSTSLAGSMASMTVLGVERFGSGSCTRMPCTAGSPLSFAISASSSACATSAGSPCSNDAMPAAWVCLPLLRT